jgi:uracil-DNA glycosylase
VNARDRLRLYLEQRRDMGETELLLDSMTVDDVMKAIGAIDAGTTGEPVAATSGNEWREVLTEAPPPPEGLESPAVSSGLFDDDVMRLNSLKAIDSAVAKCTRCRLYRTATNPVPGEGNPKARLVCVGEAPGANEDATGRPFVGPAGNLLTKILAAVDLTREEVFIVNVLKHRPPGNRNPLPDEVAACSPYLVRQLELIKPKVIVAFGTFAAQTLLETKTPIGKLRGLVHQYHGIPLVVTYHPAALLRNPAWKRPTWEDVKLARRVLDKPTGA